MILPWVVPGGTLALPPGCRALVLLNSTGAGCSWAWVLHFSLGFLFESVIFSSLCEKERIVLLLLLEGLLSALEQNSGSSPSMAVSRQDWVRPSAGRLLLLLFKRPFMKWVLELYKILREPLMT